jgi:hypothetical protein
MTNTGNARAKKRNTKPYKKTRIRLYTNGTCMVINGKINILPALLVGSGLKLVWVVPTTR